MKGLSLMEADINAIVNNKNPIANLVLTVEMHTSKSVYANLEVSSLQIHRDYQNGFGDYALVTVKILPSQFIEFNKELDNLECALIFTYVDNNQKRLDRKTLRYKAVYHNPDRPNDTIEGGYSIGGQNLDLSGHEYYHFQLLNLSAEALRHSTISNVYHNITPYDALLTMLGTMSSGIKIRGKKAIEVINIVTPDNKNQYKDLPIPTGTYGHQIVDVLQNKYRGIYNSDAACFIQTYMDKPTWFVYPLYMKKLYTTDLPRLIIYHPKVPLYDDVDKTYLLKNKDLSIIVEHVVDMRHDETSKLIDSSNGFEYLPSDKPLKGQHTTTTSGPLVGNNYIRVTNGKRNDSNNNTRALLNISGNPFKHSSRVLNYAAKRISVIWNNSKDLLYPGMPVLYKTERNGKIITYLGQVLNTQILHQRIDGIILKNVQQKTAIQIAVFE